MIKDILKDAETRMNGAIHSLTDDLATIRTGRASPALVERLHVEYYGSPTPLMQLASISIPEPRSIMIKPFDPSTMKDIERAIRTSDLGLNPNNDGKAIHLNLPPLTEERRRDLHNDLRDFEKEKLITEDELRRGEDELQKLTDRFVEDVNRHGQTKEKEIMEV